MTWQKALAIGIALQFLAGIVFAASVDAGVDGEGSGFGLFLFAVLVLIGSIMTLAGTIGWGVKLGLREDEPERPFISEPKPPTRVEYGGYNSGG